MKRFNQLFTIFLCCIGAMSVTSCLNSDDDGGIDPETYQAYLTQMQGYYTGGSGNYANKIYFYNDTITDKNNPNKVDSVMYVTGTFAKDSTFTIANVPGRLLAKEIKDEKYKGLKEAIEKASNQTIRGKFLIVSLYENVANMYFYPTAVTYKNLSYNGETHDVMITFYGPSWGSWGIVNAHRMAEYSVCMSAIYVDDNKILTMYDGSSYNQEAIDKASLSIRVAQP